MKKIVLAVNEQEKLCKFPVAAWLKVLRHTGEHWEPEKLVPLNLKVTNTEELRANTREAISAIPECKILVAQGITGIPYYVFDKMGFAIFEAPSVSKELLDEVIAEVDKNEKTLAADSLLPRAPVEVTDGCYYLDFLLLEQAHPEVTTKQALLPFLEETPFISLTLRISHVPPWLEFGRYTEKLEMQVKELKDAVMVTLRPKVCGG